MACLVRYLTGYNSAAQLQLAAYNSKSKYYVIDAKGTVPEGSLQHILEGGELKIIGNNNYPKARKAWESVEFRSRVGSVVLALTSVAVVVGGVRSIQNKSSNQILGAIFGCFLVNMGLLLATLSVLKKTKETIISTSTASRIAFDEIVRNVKTFRSAVLKDGLKALKDHSGSMSLFTHAELIWILRNLKETYNEVWDFADEKPPTTFGEFLSEHHVLEDNFNTLSEKHPVRLAIDEMFDQYEQFPSEIEFFQRQFRDGLSGIFKKDVDGNNHAKVLEKFSFPSLNRDIIKKYECRALETVYEEIILALEEREQPKWREFCKQKFLDSCMTQFFEQSFRDLCLGQDALFHAWLRQQIENLQDDDDNGSFFLACFDRAMPAPASRDET